MTQGRPASAEVDRLLRVIAAIVARVVQREISKLEV